MSFLQSLFERGTYPSLVRAQLGFLGLLSGLMGYFATPYIGLATLSFGLMNFGLLHRYQKILHMRLMVGAIVVDFAIVLALELSRSAVETVVQSPLNLFQQAHVSVSLLALLLYLPTIYFGVSLGYRKISQPPSDGAQLNLEVSRESRAELISLRRRHRVVALTAYALRLIGFVTMFSMLSRK